ncbi:MAG: sugar phosphate isomerase/epimerase [Clostridia bacterium]|nr:sugar phosphate isomerase/epimerase [Clostridia bacterium]
MAKLILSAFADEYSRDVDGQIDVLTSLGYSYLEPRFIGEKNIADLTESEATELRAKLDNAGIGVYSIGSPIGKINLSDDFDAHLALAENCFRVANILGATRVRMFSFYLPEGKTREECFDAVLERINALLDLADKYGLILCHENEARIFGESPEDCKKLLDATGKRLRAVFDMGNFVLDKYNPENAYALLSDHVDYFHIKDALYERAIVPAGLGEAKIAEILAAHLKRGKDTVITLEPHLESFDGLNKLAGTSFKNPYVFESPKHAFLAGADYLAKLVSGIEKD